MIGCFRHRPSGTPGCLSGIPVAQRRTISVVARWKSGRAATTLIARTAACFVGWRSQPQRPPRGLPDMKNVREGEGLVAGPTGTFLCPARPVGAWFSRDSGRPRGSLRRTRRRLRWRVPGLETSQGRYASARCRTGQPAGVVEGGRGGGGGSGWVGGGKRTGRGLEEPARCTPKPQRRGAAHRAATSWRDAPEAAFEPTVAGRGGRRSFLGARYVSG